MAQHAQRDVLENIKPLSVHVPNEIWDRVIYYSFSGQQTFALETDRSLDRNKEGEDLPATARHTLLIDDHRAKIPTHLLRVCRFFHGEGLRGLYGHGNTFTFLERLRYYQDINHFFNRIGQVARSYVENIKVTDYFLYDSFDCTSLHGMQSLDTVTIYYHDGWDFPCCLYRGYRRPRPGEHFAEMGPLLQLLDQRKFKLLKPNQFPQETIPADGTVLKDLEQHFKRAGYTFSVTGHETFIKITKLD